MSTDETEARIIAALQQREAADAILRDLLPPCPECCPDGRPEWPCQPGEQIVGPGEIGICEECWGRGYVEPSDEDDEDEDD